MQKTATAQQGLLVSVDQEIEQVLAQTDQLCLSPSCLLGVSTGIPALDELTRGLPRAGLTVIGRGFLTPEFDWHLLAHIAKQVAVDQAQPVLFISLQRPAENVVAQMLCASAAIPCRNLATGALDPQDTLALGATAAQLKQAPLFMADADGFHPGDIKVHAEQLLARYGGLGLIVVDSIDMMAAEWTGRRSRIAYLARSLKQLAKEFRCPVVTTSATRDFSYKKDWPAWRPYVDPGFLRHSHALRPYTDLFLLLYSDKNAPCPAERDPNAAERVDISVYPTHDYCHAMQRGSCRIDYDPRSRRFLPATAEIATR